MDGQVWYFEYEVVALDENFEEKIYRGIVTSDSGYGGAAEYLDKYYGEELIKIRKLFCSHETVYEFNHADAEFKIHLEA